MPLSNIIDTVCEKIGFNAVSNRTVLLNMINRAAKEIYEADDYPGSLREIVALVPPGNVIALPYFVGELRAMREYYSKAKVELKEMAPKYSYNPWPELWRSWRILKKSPIQTCIQRTDRPITLSIPEADSSDFTVTIVGQTEDANRKETACEFTAGETEITCNTPYIEITAISKPFTTYNVTVKSKDTSDADLTLAVIPNDQRQSLYTIVDVSELPSTGENGTGNRYIDVLYKEPLQFMSQDGDAFPVEGFDDAIVYKTLEHWFSEQGDGGEKALGYMMKCNQVIFQRVNHTNGTTQKQITFGPNQYLDLYPRYPRRVWRGGVLR